MRVEVAATSDHRRHGTAGIGAGVCVPRPEVLCWTMCDRAKECDKENCTEQACHGLSVCQCLTGMDLQCLSQGSGSEVRGSILAVGPEG